jgi:hypothetical protein
VLVDLTIAIEVGVVLAAFAVHAPHGEVVEVHPGAA